ncbi:MAG: aminotransferase class V-fold PLP-dependent enzyme [Bryobacterales bacterium]|nr:aminotransferase class V-fold PLP-dependent enzyme [Bryobacterales bacterium]
MRRREFLAGAAALSAAAQTPPDFSALRADFPRAMNETYFNSAAQHPLGNHTVQAMHRYLDFLHKGPGEGREDFWETGYREVKPMFAKLIGAKPSEIVFTASTTVGENTILNGMDFGGGNIVTNDLHYTSCLANYKHRQKQGLDVRIVRHRDWRIDIKDMERAVNNKTKLIAVSWVSSVNGHREDLKALSDLAHAHGAYLFADIIQGTGAVPLDVKAMGVDFASCAMYKWLQGEHGFGFLYCREDLGGSVVKPRLFGGSLDFNYRPWIPHPKPGVPELQEKVPTGVASLECGTPSVITYAGQHASFKYIEKLGVERIQAHAQTILGRLRRELSSRGYTPITPEDAKTSILTFLCDAAKVREKIQRANQQGRSRILLAGPNSALTVGRFGTHLRFSASVFNNQQDVDKILEILA